MKISELRVFEEEDYVGEHNLNKSERDLVCKALVLSRGNIIDASLMLRVVDRKVYSAIFQHNLQFFLEQVRNGRIVSTKNIDALIVQTRIKTLTQN